MAIDFADVKIHSRSKGQSAVAAAAYRSASKLHDERTGETHNYENKEHVIYDSIMLPDGADEKFKDREYLWNEVEKAEKKSNARVSKDIIIALPKELTQDEWIELSRRYADEQFVSKGIVADLAIHNVEGNPHCHILVTTRRLLGNKFDSHKARDMDGEMRHSQHGDFTSQKNTYNTDWKNLQNKYFEEKHLDYVVDQNYLIKQKHHGRVTSESHYLKEENALKVEQSKEIALNNPELAVTILSQRNTVFSEKDIESFAYKHSSSKEEFLKVKENIISDKNVIELGPGDDGRIRYTTKHAVRKENTLLNDASKLNKQNGHSVSKENAKVILSNNSLMQGQEKAFNHLLSSSDIAVVVGKPGTGKSYMLNSAREAWEREGYRVNGAAVSGVATEGLRTSSGINSRVIASWNYCIEKGYKTLTERDIFVIDEAGMVDTYDLAKLANHVKTKGAKLVLVGDPDQLQPVGPGASLKGIMQEVGYVEMSEIIRQEKEWQRTATTDLATGEGRGLDAYHENGNIKISDTKIEAVKELIEDWSKEVSPGNLHDSIIIAHTNKDVDLLNNNAREQLINKGLLDKSMSKNYSNSSGQIELAVGEKIIFHKGDKDIKVNNGTFGTVVNVGDDHFQVELKTGGTVRSIDIDPNTYKGFNYGYAATVHKLQSATVDNSYLYAGGRGWNKNLTLVGLSRHKKDVKVYADNETYKDYDSLKELLLRGGYKDSVLDYPVSYSLRRGIDPDTVIGKALDRIGAIKEKIADKWNFLFDYQKYIEKQEELQKREELAAQRKDAIKVASFVDSKHELYDLSRNINSELADKQKFHEHKEYGKYYAALSDINKQAHYFYNNYEKYERALKANNIDISDLKAGADAFNREQNVRNLFLAYNANDKDSIAHYSNEISKDIKGHYRYFDHYNTTGMDLKDVSSYIQQQGTLHNYNELIKGRGAEFVKAANEIKAFYDFELQRKEFWRTVFGEQGETSSPDANTEAIKLSDEQKNIINDINSKLREAAFKIEELPWEREYANVFDALKIDEKALEKRCDEHIYYQLNSYRKDVAVAWGKYQEKHQAVDKINALVSTERRNIAAYNILQQYDRFADIIERSNLNREDIEKYAESAIGSLKSIERIKEYTGIYSEGESEKVNALACEIILKDKNYSTNLQLVCEDHDLNPTEVKKVLDINAYEHFIKGMNQKEIMDFHVVRDFAKSYTEYRDLISDYHHKGFDELSPGEKQKMFASSAALENKAHAIYNNIESSRRALDYHHIQQELINKYEDKYQQSLLRDKARSLKTAKVESGKNWGAVFDKGNEELTKRLSVLSARGATRARDMVAAEILPNIESYRKYLSQFKITDSDVIRYASRKKVSDYYYNKVQAAKAFQAYSEDKELNEELLNKGIGHIEERNKLAYEIVSHPEQYAEHIKKQDIKQLHGFKNQAAKYAGFLDSEGGEALSQKAIDKNLALLFPGIKEEPKKEKVTVSRETFKRLDYQKINDALLLDPEATYTRIFGEPKQRSSKELRYSGGLIVTLTGSNAGQWYDFSGSGKCGGGPIQAIEYKWGTDFKAALERGLEIAGLSREQAQESVLYSPPARTINREKKLQDLLEQRKSKKQRLQTARYYWDSSRDITGSIGEKYLREHRGITGNISEFRIHSKVFDSETRQYYPGIIIPGRNKYGKVTAVQSIILNPETGNKAEVKTVKRTRGLLKGSACLINQGKDDGFVILAEGPETGASIASAMPDAHVYITLGNFKNAEQLGWLAEKHNTDTLILAADNDGNKSRIEKTVAEVSENLKGQGINCIRVKPELEGREKVDFNDILEEHGVEAVKEFFTEKPQIELDQPEDIQTPESPKESFQEHKDALYEEMNKDREKLIKERDRIVSSKKDELNKLNEKLSECIKEYESRNAIRQKFTKGSFEKESEALYQAIDEKKAEIKKATEEFDNKTKKRFSSYRDEFRKISDERARLMPDKAVELSKEQSKSRTREDDQSLGRGRSR